MHLSNDGVFRSYFEQKFFASFFQKRCFFLMLRSKIIML